MALRAGYKGFKKLMAPLKIIRPGTLGIDNDVLIPELNKTFFPRSEQAVLGAVNQFDKTKYKSTWHATVTQTATGIRVVSEDAGTYRNITYEFSTLKLNTNYVVSTDVTVTDGTGMIGIKGSTDGTTWNNIQINPDITADGKVDVSFNTGNYPYIDIQFNATTSTSEDGDVTYNDIILSLNGNDYVPYAMTNRELTEKATVQTITHAEAVTEGDVSVTFTEYITGNVEQIVGEVVSSVDKDVSSQSGVSIGTYLAHKPLASLEVIGSINSSVSASDRKPINSITMSNTGRIGVNGQMVANRAFQFTLTYIFGA